MASTDTMADLDATVRIRRPGSVSGLPSAPSAPLRRGAVDAALGRGRAEALAAFLAEPDPLAALRAWFGPELLRYAKAGRWADIVAALDRDIAALDDLMSRQLDAILHHPRLQAMEARWRGVAYLTRNAGHADENVVIRVLNVSWPELCQDFDRSPEFDQSQLFEKVYSEEFGMPGGRPYGLLVVDHRCSHRRIPGQSTDDVGGLRVLSQVAAASFAPTVIGAHPALLGLDSFAELGHPLDLGRVFRAEEYRRWLGFQETEDARYVGVVLPGILMREPWRDGAAAGSDRFPYREGADGLDHEHYLWGGGVFAFAAVVIRAYRLYGWFADIRGARLDGEDGGVVTGLPAPAFPTDHWDAARRRPVEAELTDAQEQELGNLGFIALSPSRYTSNLVFLGNQSAQRRTADQGIATVNARLGTMLQYVLCVSRFSHYVKVMARDRLGGFATAAQLEAFLSDWLRSYSLGNDDASPEQKARYPLRASAVQIRDVPGKPGTLSCVFHLQPHFQLDQVVSAFRLRTELVAAKIS